MTNKEKKQRAKIRKELQEKGIIPPDKPRLNRKKFIEEAREEWNGRDKECSIWDFYLVDAVSYVLEHADKSMRPSLEAVGVAKALKIAVRLRKFSEDLKSKGEHEYRIIDKYNYIKDILDA